MTGFSKIIVTGNLTKDPEVIRFKQSDTVKVNLRLAVNGVPYTDSQGAKQSEVVFIDAEAWGKTAETIGKYFKKGNPILVEGKLAQSDWEDKTTGTKRSKHFIKIQTFSFLSGNGEDVPSQPAKTSQAQTQDTSETIVDEPDVDVSEAFDSINFL